MADPYAPEGVLPNVLRWIDRPGQAVRNVLKLKPGAAGRQLADFVLEPLDAALPGDLIPSVTENEDYTSGSELIGLDPNAPAWQRVSADIGVGLATDPLTYLSFGAVGAGKAAAQQGVKYGAKVGVPFMKPVAEIGSFGQAIDPLSLAMRGADTGLKKGLSKLDEKLVSPTQAGTLRTPLSTGYENLKAATRRTVGAEDLTPEARATMQSASSVGSTAAKLWSGKVADTFKGVKPQDRILLTLAHLGVDGGSLDAKAIKQVTPLAGNLNQRIEQLAATYGRDADKLKRVAAQMGDINKAMFAEGVGKGVFKSGKGREDYLQRQWITGDSDLLDNTATPSALKKASLTTQADIVNFFNKGDVGMELDAAKLMADRAAQQGRMLQQASIGGKYAPGTFMAGSKASDKEIQALDDALATGQISKESHQLQMDKLLQQASMKKDALAAIDADLAKGVLNRDSHYALKQALEGMKPRGSILGALSGVNRNIKGAMVYGVVIPKFGSLIRNKIGMGFQSLATPGVEGQALKNLNPVNIVNDMGRAWDEAFHTTFGTSGKFARGDTMGKAMSDLERAFKEAKNTDDVAAKLRSYKRGDLAEAVENGVLDGFVSSEELIKQIERSPNMQRWVDVVQAPAVMFQTMEQRGRLQAFLDLRAKHGGAKAAQMTKDALYDYGVNSPENRAMRDIIPFGQFVAKSIPQQASMLSRTPAVGAAMAPLFYDPSGEQGPVYPYMQSKSRINVGADDKGNDLYLTGFGLPAESINMIPNFSGDLREAGRGISQGLLSSTQPLLKTAGALATGTDPYFGTPFGSYDKIPLVGNAGAAGRAFNVLSGTGVLEPFGGGALRQLGNALDESKPIGARAADFLTGAKLTAVDPDLAEQRAITQALSDRPEIKQYRTFYTQEPDEEFAQLMQALKEAKQRSKMKREAAAAAAP